MTCMAGNAAVSRHGPERNNVLDKTARLSTGCFWFLFGDWRTLRYDAAKFGAGSIADMKMFFYQNG